MNVLLIEDNEDDKDILETLMFSGSPMKFSHVDVRLTWAKTLKQGRNALKASSFDLVFLDISLPDSQGIRSIDSIEELKTDCAIVVLTGNQEEQIGIDSVRLGADGYLVKGQYTQPLLMRSMLHAVERRRGKIALAKSQSELLESKLAAEAANDAKTVFLAMMSHEFRTPLQNLLGFLNLLEDTELDEEQREYIAISLKNVERLNVLIDDIVDHSKIEKGTMNIENRPFDPQACFNEAVDIIERKMKGTGPEIIPKIERAPPSLVSGDPGRLMQVLTNLLTNARKFTPSSGTITLSLQTSEEPDGYRFEFAVKDSGKGMHAESLKTIFAPFKQANPESDQAIGGTGLGLAICKRLCELMGGSIHIESAPGEGTCVSFDVLFDFVTDSEIRESIEPNRTDQLKAQICPLHVLIAEDNVESGFVLKKQVSKLGHTSKLVKDGESALKSLQDEQFDLILMDTRMPLMSGLEATEAIRNGQAGNTNTQIPIISISANSAQRDVQIGKAKGIDEFLNKPIHLKDLKATLERYAEPVLLEK
ncbi:MAG: response regulator [Verrucomicrobiota bacterium]